MHSRSNTKWSVVSSFMISARVCNPYERFCSVLLTIESSLVLRATSNLLMSQQRPRTICSKQSSRRSRPYYKRKRRKISSNQHYKETHESYIPKGIISILFHHLHTHRRGQYQIGKKWNWARYCTVFWTHGLKLNQYFWIFFRYWGLDFSQNVDFSIWSNRKYLITIFLTRISITLFPYFKPIFVLASCN